MHSDPVGVDDGAAFGAHRVYLCVAGVGVGGLGGHDRSTAEGFGLSHAESLMCGTPIINNVTGGLQDGCRFEDENGDWIEFTTDFPSNHDGTYTEHGAWAKPIFPSNRSLQGSPMTPYIFDDRVDFRDLAEAIKYWYIMPKKGVFAASARRRRSGSGTDNGAYKV